MGSGGNYDDPECSHLGMQEYLVDEPLLIGIYSKGRSCNKIRSERVSSKATCFTIDSSTFFTLGVALEYGIALADGL